MYTKFGGKPRRERPIGGPRHKCEDNINIDIREKGWGGMDWVDLVQDEDQW
jgi:hypothetical protein